MSKGSTRVAMRKAGLAKMIPARQDYAGLALVGPGELTDYLFTGQHFEEELGLYWVGSRWYDPSLGRFVQADSIVPGMDNPQRWDRFGYVLNNPLRYTDPSGHSPAGPCPPGDNCDTDQGNGQEDNTEPDSGTDDGGCGGQGCDLGGNNDDDNSTDDGNSRSDDGSIEDQMPDGNPTISQKPLAKTICAVGNKCKVKNAIAGTVIIVVGGFFFIVGAGFSFAAMAAGQWELAGATALISAGGGFIAWAGIQALIKSECLPSINWSP